MCGMTNSFEIATPQVAGRSLIDLSHVIVDGMATYPGLPTPVVATHLSREASEEIYGPGTTFQNRFDHPVH